MNALTARTLSTFPAELQSHVRAHRFDDLDELVQQVALALLEAKSGDTLAKIFNRARSATRRITQDPAFWGRDVDIDAAAPIKKEEKIKKKQVVQQVAADQGVSDRRARQIVAEQLERAKQGDLFSFSDDESEVTV